MKRLLAISIVCAAGTAHADTKAHADELFRRAKQLMAEHKYTEACAKFEESYQLDPGIGGELNIGRCYEEWGKLGHAYHAYVEAERQAKASSDPREAKIQELIAALEPQVPRLVLHVPAGATPENVTIDGAPVAPGDLANPQIVDPGPKQVEYTIAGAKTSKLVPVDRGHTVDVTLDAAATATAPIQPPPSAPSEGHPGATLRIAGIGVGAIGIAGVAIGSYLALSARSNYRSALGADCMGMADQCDADGLTATHDARTRANIATGVFVGGVAFVAGGLLMYFIAPHAATGEHAYYVAPTGNGVAFGGQY